MLGILSSIEIAVRGNFSLQILNSNWPAPSRARESLWMRLLSSRTYRDLDTSTDELKSPLDPYLYLSTKIDDQSETHSRGSGSRFSILCADFNGSYFDNDGIRGMARGSVREWANRSGWRHPKSEIPITSGDNPSLHWATHFPGGSDRHCFWSDHILLKGSAVELVPSYLGVEQGEDWRDVSTHRPITVGLECAVFGTTGETPTNTLQAPHPQELASRRMVKRARLPPH